MSQRLLRDLEWHAGDKTELLRDSQYHRGLEFVGENHSDVSDIPKQRTLQVHTDGSASVSSLLAQQQKRLSDFMLDKPSADALVAEADNQADDAAKVRLSSGKELLPALAALTGNAGLQDINFTMGVLLQIEPDNADDRGDESARSVDDDPSTEAERTAFFRSQLAVQVRTTLVGRCNGRSLYLNAPRRRCDACRHTKDGPGSASTRGSHCPSSPDATALSGIGRRAAL